MDFVRLSDYCTVADRLTSSAQAAFDAATLVANESDLPLYVEGDWLLSRSIYVDRLLGEKGKNRIIVADNCVSIGPDGTGGYCIYNTSYSRYGKTPDASIISWNGVEVVGNGKLSIAGLANVKSGRISNCSILSDYPSSQCNVDSVLDFRATCKNIDVTDCLFINRNSKTFSTPNDGGGGGCIWIRNHLLDGAVDAESETENIKITRCEFRHRTSDEVVAMFGCGGVVRDCSVEDNDFYCEAPDSSAGPHRNNTLTIFPLGWATGRGVYSSVHGNKIKGNRIYERGGWANCIRVGLWEDRFLQCYNNEVTNNTILFDTKGDPASTTNGVVYVLEATYPAELADAGNVVKNNDILVIGGIKYGVFGADRAARNRVSGTVTYPQYPKSFELGPLITDFANIDLACDALRLLYGSVNIKEASGLYAMAGFVRY